MKKRFGFAIAAIAFCCATAAMATPTTLDVQFVNTQGQVIIGAEVGVYNEQGEIIQKLPPSVVYTVIAEEGSKVLFALESNFYGSIFVETVIPLLAVEPYQIVVPDPPAPQQAPPNDLCADAIPVLLPSVTAGTTVGATTDSEQPGCTGGSITSPGVWYEFIGTGNNVTADLCNGATGYDSKLSVYCLDCADPVCAANGNDDSCGLQSLVTACTQPGAIYRVLVHGFGGSTGPFELTLTEGSACSADVECIPPPPTGACCDCDAEGYNCEQLTADMCAAQGKDYYGDDVPCTITGGNPISYSSMPGIPITDNTEFTDTISVTDVLLVGDVNVGVVVDHTWIGDLIMTLVAPNGDEVELWDRNCSSNDNLDVVFDDAGGTVVCASPTQGTYAPLSAGGGELSTLNGISSFGDWTLRISDNAGGDQGTWHSWFIELDTATPTCPDQNDGSCFLCDGTGGDDEDEDEDEDGDAEDTGVIDDGSVGGGFIELMLNDTPRSDDYSAMDEDANERDNTRRVTRTQRGR